ncbi:uncharacterized protein LOC124155187 [Ischnura elegans]|uniref:uncharacterized protein LOC124155187 n=1 Tax=Ischnura elegans TaxID=197161 RepID=UPI001ED8A046|nr:uncharacterized protein LOC124155187 [Ischnura elegans]
MREAIPVRKKVAIALYFLKSGSDYGVVGMTFGVGRSTVSAIVEEFCAAVRRQYHPRIRFPATEEDMRATANEFQYRWDFPGVIGVVDGCHKREYRQISRTWQQLKRSWENLKAKRKRDLAALNQQRMATGGGPYVPQVVDTTPELGVVFPSIEHNIPNTGDSDEVPTVEAAAVPEVQHEVPPPTSKNRKGSKRSVVEREAEERLAKVRCLREKEAYICQMRWELLMMDMKVKEDESAATAAKRLSAENEAAASASLR